MEIGTHLLVSKNNYYQSVCVLEVLICSPFSIMMPFLLLEWMFCSLTENTCFSDLVFIFVFFHFLRCLFFNKFLLIHAASVKRFFLLTSLRMVLPQKIIYGIITYLLWPSWISLFFNYSNIYHFTILYYKTHFRKYWILVITLNGNWNFLHLSITVIYTQKIFYLARLRGKIFCVRDLRLGIDERHFSLLVW